MGLEIYPKTPRLVNRFSLGADPEFVFTTPSGSYQYAENCGLTTSRAFGCDMAGRQAEIRAYPSKFALRVVASIVDSLRWLAITHRNETCQLTWSAMAFNGKDGCGGHIHLGRRRPDRNVDVVILDATLKTLLALGVLDKYKFQERVTYTNHYGRYGDIRPQSHGYEYRTLPTQMASPWLMYFVLVLNKLLIHLGDQTYPSTLDTKAKIVALFTSYKDRDDDAAIALQALTNWGLPTEDFTDFRARWGVETLSPMLYSGFSNHFFPSVIKPQEETCHELFEYLTQGKALIRRYPQATWEPFQLDRGFYNVATQKHTLGHLPDVAKDLISKGVRVTVVIGEDFNISHEIPLPVSEIRKAIDMPVHFFWTKGYGVQIAVPPNFNKSLIQCRKLHEVLSNTELFPVCKAENYRTVDWTKWDNLVFPVSKTPLGRLRGRVAGKPPDTVVSKVEPVVKKKVPRPREEW